MKTIKLSDHTELEQKFLKAAVNEWNDLMFTDDLDHGIAIESLGGVAGSLVKKGIIEVYESPALNGYGGRNIGEFQFIDENGDANFDEAPTLI